MIVAWFAVLIVVGSIAILVPTAPAIVAWFICLGVGVLLMLGARSDNEE